MCRVKILQEVNFSNMVGGIISGILSWISQRSSQIVCKYNIEIRNLSRFLHCLLSSPRYLGIISETLLKLR
jgi:hypothetical protein